MILIMIFTPDSGNAPFSRVILLPLKMTSSELKWSLQILSFCVGISTNPRLFIQRNNTPLFLGKEKFAFRELQIEHLTILNKKICIAMKMMSNVAMFPFYEVCFMYLSLPVKTFVTSNVLSSKEVENEADSCIDVV